METSCSTVTPLVSHLETLSDTITENPKSSDNFNFNDQRKIYILRHEERFNDISFATHLTPLGLYNAENKVCSMLDQLNISHIYCSPFIRTLETIKPFCNKTTRKVNIEWSLVESFPYDPTIPHNLKSIINPNYTSYTPYIRPFNNNLLSFEDLVLRVSSFLNSITDRNSNILLVTHMPVINAILHSKGLKQYAMGTYHEPGSLSYVQRV